MNIWNCWWVNPRDMFNLGYNLINTDDAYLYIVPGANYYKDYLDTQWLYNNWEVNKFSNGVIIPEGSKQMRGGMFALWNDKICEISNGAVEYDLTDRILPAMQVLSEKMWGEADDKTFDQFKELAEEVNIAPNTNPRHEVKSNGETVLEYDFSSFKDNTLEDKSGSGYNSISANNVYVKNGVLQLLGENSYIETGINNIGPDYSISFKINRDNDSDNSEQILFESPKGEFKAVQSGTGKLGFSREGYDYSFDYELPKGEWVDISIVGKLKKTEIYVNGELVEQVLGNDSLIIYSTFVFPLAKIGSETNAFKGKIDDFKVINKVVISDKTIIPQEQMIATSTSHQPGQEAEKAIDGDESTLWHTDWEGITFPQNITLNLGGNYEINKVTCLPRQSGDNGKINSYELQVSTDGEKFTTIAEGIWDLSSSRKDIKFEPVQASHIRLVANSASGSWVSIAELNVHKVINTVNKNDLSEVINRANSIIQNESDNYTEGSIRELKYVINMAEEVLINKNATQEQVNVAKVAIENAINNLEKKEEAPEFVDKKALKISIDYANQLKDNGVLNNIVPAVAKEFNEALTKAEAIYSNENATNKEVKAAFDRLVSAIHMLEFTQGDKSELENLINSVNAMNKNNYTEESWANLEIVLSEANNVMADENAMQDEVNEIVNKLQ